MEVFAISDAVFSPLGATTAEVLGALRANNSGITLQKSPNNSLPSYSAATIGLETVDLYFTNMDGDPTLYTKLEKMFIVSISNILKTSEINVSGADTLFVFSTTKGNIDLLEKRPEKKISENRIYLHQLANAVCRFFNNPNPPVVVSSACISGVLAIITAKKLLQTGKYKNIIVAGGDIVSEFTLSGFQSFQAISPVVCQPFDSLRQGISLGEGCAALLLSSDISLLDDKNRILIGEGATSNDANHISGPSRTGEGLFLAINKVIEKSKIHPSDIGYVSAHGTGTMYNDEMEAKALKTAGLEYTPVNSLKAYFGHTLGAAGVIESIIAIHSLKENELFRSLGYNNHGVSEPMNIITENRTSKIEHALKLASGFGGCNAALLLSKEDLGQN